MPTPPPLEPLALQELVKRAASGERPAFDSLVEQFTSLVWSVCATNGLSRHESEDVAQGVWLRVVEHLGNIREPERFAGWLSAITRNECMATIRYNARARQRAIDAEVHVEPSVPGPEAAAVEQDVHAHVRRALASLDDRCRELLLLLTAAPQLSYNEVSAAMQMPVASIGPTRSRCLEKLRRSPAIVAVQDRG